jgi:hypothetical protein
MSKGTMTRLCRRRFPCLTLRKEQTERLHKIDWLRSDCRGVFALVGNGDMAAAPRGSGKPSLSTKLETVQQFALFAGVTSADGVDIFVVPFIRWNNRVVWMVFLADFCGERCQLARRDRGGND